MTWSYVYAAGAAITWWVNLVAIADGCIRRPWRLVRNVALWPVCGPLFLFVMWREG